MVYLVYYTFQWCEVSCNNFLLLCFVAVLGILVLSGLVLLPVLLPVAATDNSVKESANSTTSNGTFSDLDKLSMGNVGVSSI